MEYDTNETETDSHREQTVVAKGEGAGRGMDWEFGISRCKLLHIEWINKVPLNNTGNYMEENMKKNVCVCK